MLCLNELCDVLKGLKLLVKNVVNLLGQYVTLKYDADLYKGQFIQTALEDLDENIPAYRNIKFDKEQYEVVDGQGLTVVPAAIDIHVHSRDPGFTYKEDWLSLEKACYKGGVAAVCDMPNTMPATMDRESIRAKELKAHETQLFYKFFLGVGKNNIHELKDLLLDDSLNLSGLKVYYGQSTGDLMYSDLEKLHEVLPQNIPGMLVFHSEDQCMIDHNAEDLKDKTHQCTKPRDFAVHSTLRSSEAAMSSTKIILEWALKNKRKIHIAHVSTPQEIKLIEKFKARGLKVSSEVAPHHLFFSTDDYERLGALIKMNPPVRSKEEVEELRRLFSLGKIEYFATDHAPHTLEEKNQSYNKCPSGVPALELYWPLLLQLKEELNMPGSMVLDMAYAKANREMGFEKLGYENKDQSGSFSLIEKCKYKLTRESLVAKVGWSPYEGLEFNYRVYGTWHNNKMVYSV